MKMKKRTAKRLQKAVNHSNKVMFRLKQLERDGIHVTAMLEDADRTKQRLIVVAKGHGKSIKKKGMPR